MPSAARWVGDDEFERVVCRGSEESLVLAAFLERDDGLVEELERMCIDRGGCFNLAFVLAAQAPRTIRCWNRRGLPAVHAFRDGEQLACFDGPAIVAAARTWLDAALPREAERTAVVAERWSAMGDMRALAAYRQALACDPGCSRALLGRARLHAAVGDHARALALATRVPRADALGGEAAKLAARLRRDVDPEGEEAAVRGRLAMDFGDHEARRQLVDLLERRGKHDEAEDAEGKE